MVRKKLGDGGRLCHQEHMMWRRDWSCSHVTVNHILWISAKEIVPTLLLPSGELKRQTMRFVNPGLSLVSTEAKQTVASDHGLFPMIMHLHVTTGQALACHCCLR